jgi:hypothetical protein
VHVIELSTETFSVTHRYETEKLDQQIAAMDAREDIRPLSAAERTAREKYKDSRKEFDTQKKQYEERLKHAHEQRLLPECGDLLKGAQP